MENTQRKTTRMIKVIEYIDHKEWLKLRKGNAEQK